MDLISIILLVVFVVLPLINGVIRRTNQPPRPSQRPPRPGTPTPGTSSRPDTRTQGTQQGTQQSTQRQDDSFRGRLDEARRRVQQAMEEEGTRSQSGRGRPSSSRPATPPLVSPGQQTQRSARGQAQPQRDTPRPTRRTPSGLSAGSTSFPEEAPPMQTERLGHTAQQSGTGKVILSYDRRSIVQALVWREVLDKPLSKRPPRRSLTQSSEQSLAQSSPDQPRRTLSRRP